MICEQKRGNTPAPPPAGLRLNAALGRRAGRLNGSRVKRLPSAYLREEWYRHINAECFLRVSALQWPQAEDRLMVRFPLPALVFVSISLPAICGAYEDEGACSGLLSGSNAWSRCESRNDAEVQERRLNDAYQALTKELVEADNEDDLKNLREAERQWSKFRESECSFRQNVDKGEPGGPEAIYASCSARFGKDRAESLIELTRTIRARRTGVPPDEQAE